MQKIRRIFETTQEINFNSPQKEFYLYWDSFEKSELGRIYRSIPWEELVKSLKVKEHRKGPLRLLNYITKPNASNLRIINFFVSKVMFKQLFVSSIVGI